MDAFPSLNNISQAINWFHSGLLACLPDRLKKRYQKHSYLLCDNDAHHSVLNLHFIKGDGESELKSSVELSQDSDYVQATINHIHSKYPDTPVYLYIPESQCLVREISLPLKVADNLQSVLQNEIDRQTPFTREQVYWGYEIKKADKTSNLMTLNLVVVPRLFADTIIHEVSKASITINGFIVTDHNILIPILGNEFLSHFPLKAYALSLIAFMLIASVIYKPVFFYQKETSLLSEKLSSIREEAKETLALKKDNEALKDTIQLFNEQYAQYPSRVQILDELSRRLPKDTWLESLAIENDKIIVTGYTRSGRAILVHFQNMAIISSPEIEALEKSETEPQLSSFRVTGVLTEAAAK